MSDREDKKPLIGGSKFAIADISHSGFGDEWDTEDNFDPIDLPNQTSSSSQESMIPLESTQLDEALARQLHEELNSNSSTPESSSYSNYIQPEHTHVPYEELQVVEAPEEYQRYLNTLKFISLFKIACVMLLAYTLLSLMFKIFIVAGGILVGIYGLWVARYMRKFNLLVFMGLLVLDCLVEFIGSIAIYGVDKSENKVKSGGLLTLFTHLFVVATKLAINYAIYKKWKSLPTDGLRAFDKYRTDETIGNSEFIV